MEHGEGEHSCFPKKKGFKFQPPLSTNTYCTTLLQLGVCMFVGICDFDRPNEWHTLLQETFEAYVRNALVSN